MRAEIVGEQPAGSIEESISRLRGEAVRIFTGAPIPDGADAVVMQEDAEREGDFIVINADRFRAGEFIRDAAVRILSERANILKARRNDCARQSLRCSRRKDSTEVEVGGTCAGSDRYDW